MSGARTGVLFLAAALCLPATKVVAVEYTGHTHRDPFSDPRQAAASGGAPVDTAAQQERQLAATPVQGILFSSGESRAIVDGKIVKVGSRVGAGRIVAIDRDGVTIELNGKNFTLKPKRGGGGHGTASTKPPVSGVTTERGRA